MDTKEKTLKKQQEVLGGFDKNNYVSERVYATARDGVQVPVSLVYRKGTKKDGAAPLLQYAYGSYGYSMDPGFSSTRLSLLDRGFIFAIAHIRGGQEMGRRWYEDGKMLKKKNTFNDFVDVSEYLIKNKYTSADKLFAMGGSAGGLLMGAVINQAPQLYRGVVAAVPFVDVVTTMLDETIPLTTGEFEEWGNPKNKEYYDYMLSYSPYDNVEKQAYPNLLVTTGLHDSQVQYWEPAKWVAKLRVMKTNTNRRGNPVAAAYQYGSGTRWRIGPFSGPKGNCFGIRVYAESGRSERVEGRRENLPDFGLFIWSVVYIYSTKRTEYENAFPFPHNPASQRMGTD